MTPSKALFWSCICFVGGIALESFIKIPQIFVWGVLVVSLALMIVSILFHKKKVMVVGFLTLCFLVGTIRLQGSEFNVATNKLRMLNDTTEKVSLVGRAIAEPDMRESSQKLTIKTDEGLVLVTVRNYPAYEYLDEIKIIGNLKTPVEFPDFSYKNYLMKDGIYSVMDFPKIEIVSRAHHYNAFSFLYEKVLFIKAKLMTSIRSNFSYPENTIVEGVVFGNDKLMPKELKNKFVAEGLSHITAVSGGNIVILMTMLIPCLLLVGLWRPQALTLSLVFVWLYVVLAGLPASGVRAAIMGSIFLLAGIFGRQNTSLRTIVLAAALMLLQNPLLLVYDIGFQLSFLASMGIIHGKPIFDSFLKLKEKPDTKSKLKTMIFKKTNDLLDIVSITFAAQVFTLPLLVYNFGTVSLIAPLTNVLILPMIPFLMVAGFFASVLGIFSGFLGWVFALPCYLILFYFMKVLDVFNQSWAQKSFNNISFLWVVVSYLFIAGCVIYLNRKLKPKFLGY